VPDPASFRGLLPANYGRQNELETRWGPPSQGWRTFLRNHAPDIAAMDLFVVPTVGFSLLYALVIVRVDRRVLVWINVTQNPTAEWIARQLTEAFPWNEAPGYLIRDNDRVYGNVAVRRVRAMGIRDKPIAPASPWQNGFAERLIGSIRRECVEHLVVLGEAHLRRILQRYADYTRSGRTGRWPKMRPSSVPFSGSGASRHMPSLAGFITNMSGFRFSVHTGAHLRKILQCYTDYYNKIRTHRSLGKDAPAFR
jgi:transposase InsO family protein